MKQVFSLFLILAVTLLNVPSQSEAAIITKDAEAAILSKDAEATEMMVSPGSNVGAQSSFYGVGFGVTNLGQDLWSLLKNSVETKGVNLDFEGSELVEEEGIGIEATAPVALVPQAIVRVDEEEKAAAPLVVTSAGSAVIASSDAATEVAPVATTESTTQEDEALFPLLYGSSNAAGIAGAPVEGGFLSTTAGKLTAGALLIALALGIIIPFAVGGGSGGSGAGQGSLSDPFVGAGAGAGSDDSNSGSSNPVPEPGTMLMLLLGGAGLMTQRKKLIK